MVNTIADRQYYVLSPGLRREKDQLGRDGLEVFIIDYSSVKCAYSAQKSALAEQAAWGNSTDYRITNEIPRSCSLAGRAFSTETRACESFISTLTRTKRVSTHQAADG